jgi:hypothetical protein
MSKRLLLPPAGVGRSGRLAWLHHLLRGASDSGLLSSALNLPPQESSETVASRNRVARGRAWLSGRLYALPAAFCLAGCPQNGGPDDSLNAIAADYVRTQLQIGERDPGYVDAYYGPAAWQVAARRSPRSIPKLREAIASLTTRTRSIDPAGLQPPERRRRAFLLAQLRAAETRLRILGGERLSFADEAEGLFGVRPVLKELSSYDPVLARIEQLAPGKGALAARVDAARRRHSVRKERLGKVIDAAIKECKRRTLEHISLPPGEKLTIDFVTDKSWSGYNRYRGNYTSLIEINTDLAVPINRAIDLGCHEGYPGHHVYNVLLEKRLVKDRGWVEFTIYPLFSPQSLIAEGSARYGVEIAFPAAERVKYEAEALYPLAGIAPGEAARNLEIAQALRELSGALFTITRDYLEGRIDRRKAVELTGKYQLVSRAHAERSIKFADEFRTYILNYGLGESMVRSHVEAAGPDRAARWERFQRLISEPILATDLASEP